MTTRDVQAIHEALANVVRAGIATAGDFTIKAYPSTSPTPAIEVWPDTNYVDPFGVSGPDQTGDVLLMIRVFLSAANIESEWLAVCRLLSSGAGHDSSIFDALDAAPTLGGVVDGLYVSGARWDPDAGSIDIPVAVRLC